jgi:putative DNA primase/helicase
MTSRALNLTSAADVHARPVRWLLDGLVPMGKLSVLAGAPGLGKSTWTTLLAAKVSLGEARGDMVGERGNVLIASAEDDPEDTIKPRLLAAGAECEAVYLMDVRHTDENGQVLPGIVQLPQDVGQIERAVRDHGVHLVILDPVAAFLDAGHSAYREQEVRAALTPLKTMAERTGCAVVALMHLNKTQGADPLVRIANSGAFTALARSVMVFGADPEDEDGDRGSRRVLTVAKGNLRGPGTGALGYVIATATVHGAYGQTIQTAALRETGASNVSAEDLLGNAEDRSAKGDAMQWLRELLAGDPVAAVDVQAAAKQADIAWRTVKRAKAALSVRSVKQGTDGGWVWTLPDASPASITPGPLGPLPMSPTASDGPLAQTVGPLGLKSSKEAKGANGAKGHARAGASSDRPALSAIHGWEDEAA